MRFAMLFGAVLFLHAQDTPKTKASDYPTHVRMDTVTLAAEYLVHSLPTSKGTLVANEYLVIETAFFGPPLSRLKMSPDQFTLRINGRGTPLLAQLPGMVAGSIKFPASRPHLEATGDRTSQPVTIIQKEREDSIDYRVQNASLPEGEHMLPRSGLIYFPHRGSTKNIHSIELFYDGPMGKATLKLL